jgi:hypothetical protein
MGKGRGLNEKWLKYLIFELFCDRKWSWTRSIAQWTMGGTGPRWTADRASAAAHRRNDAPMRGTSLRLRKKGEETAVILTGCKREQRRDGNGRASVGNNRWRRHSVRAALGCGAKRREAGRGLVKPKGGARLLYGPGRGTPGRGRGK